MLNCRGAPQLVGPPRQRVGGRLLSADWPFTDPHPPCRARPSRAFAGFPRRSDSFAGPGFRARCPGSRSDRAAARPGCRARVPGTPPVSDRGGNPAPTHTTATPHSTNQPPPPPREDPPEAGFHPSRRAAKRLQTANVIICPTRRLRAWHPRCRVAASGSWRALASPQPRRGCLSRPARASADCAALPSPP